MEATLPTGRAGRWLALGLAILLAGAMWFAIAMPLLDWHSERAERLAERRTLLRRMTATADTLPELRRNAAAGSQPGTAPGSLFDSASDAVAAAALQQLVQEMARRVGATLTSTETLAPSQVGSDRRVAIHVSLNAPWSVLVHLLAEIQQASPAMVVDDLQVHAGHVVRPPPDPPLYTGFTVIAFRPGSA